MEQKVINERRKQLNKIFKSGETKMAELFQIKSNFIII